MKRKRQTATDFDKGFGIGGLGRHIEPPEAVPANTPTEPLWAGTTEHGQDRGRCSICNAPAWWNPGAGQFLCHRHWDEY